MKEDRILTWWQERLSGLEIDVCPAVDFPDNEEGGAFASLTVASLDTDRDTLTAAFAYTLAKFTSQAESLFWMREGGTCHPFYVSFDETAPAGDFLADVTARRADALDHPYADEAGLAEALGLNRELLLSFDEDAAPDPAGEWKLCLSQTDGALCLFYREEWYLRENMRRLAETVVSVAKQLPGIAFLRDLT
ncbi:MAG: hypothetical protein J6V24_09350, partial [Clostridia bacterium]|nr:hypothetical protein [Clostridia bacterium]